MSVLKDLASSLGRRDEVPNQDLAKRIAENERISDVNELIENLNNKDKDIQNDCIKVLYEIGALKPSLISDHGDVFISLLESKNNRLQWGAMTALDAIADYKPLWVYSGISQILAAADKGSVITNDKCISILIKLSFIQEYSDDVYQLLKERLLISPSNQLPMYAEMVEPIVTEARIEGMITLLTSRLNDLEKESKKARVEKIIKKLKNK